MSSLITGNTFISDIDLNLFSALLRCLFIMLERLQKKWKVNGWQLVLIIATFAIGGSATGYVAKKIMNWLSIDPDWLWAIIYILLITIIWPVAVIIVSIPFGQFRFFSNYTKKLGQKIGIVRRQESGDRRQEGEVESQKAEV